MRYVKSLNHRRWWALQAAYQSLKGSSPSCWGSSGTWPGWILRKTTIMSSLPHVHHLTRGDPPVVQELLGWERLGRTYSHRISGFTQHGGRQRREILGIRSSVRQRSARSSPPRRRRWAEEMLDRVVCSREQFSFQMCLEDQRVPDSWCFGLEAALRVQLFTSVDNGWPHNVLRYH